MERQRPGFYVDPTARIAIANVTIGERRSSRSTAQVEAKHAVDTSTMKPKDDIAQLKRAMQDLKISRRRREIDRWEFESQRRFLHNRIIKTEGGE